MADALSRAIRAQNRRGKVGVIAEVKRRRAGGADLLGDRSPTEVARVYQAAGVAAISVVTSPWFGGHVRMLEEVAAAGLALPILRKDTLSTERDLEMTQRLGAAAALLVLPLLGLERLLTMVQAARSLGLEPFVELATRDEIAALQPVYNGLIAINNSDIKTSETTGEGISRSIALINRDDPRLWVSASRIDGTNDVRAVAAAGFDAILIGTHLLAAKDLANETARIVQAAERPRPAIDTRPLVKICGVQHETEVEALERLGVDFFGLVVEVDSPWTITLQRAKELAAARRGAIRPTLVTGAHPSEKLTSMVRTIGARAIQLGAATSPRQLERLRRAIGPEELVIVAEVPYAEGCFRNEDQLGELITAGADLVLVDKHDKSATGRASLHETIPAEQLAAFRDRHPNVPVVIAGGLSAANARALVAASGAVGIDVCTSVRNDGRIDAERVAQLIAQLAQG